MRRMLGHFVSMVIVAATLAPMPATAEERQQVDISKAMIAGIDKCLSPSQLDCIESVVIIAAGGKRLVANETVPASGSDIDSENQIIESGASTWEYITNSGASSSFVLDATITTPSYIVFGSLEQVEVQTTEESEAEGEGEGTEQEKTETTVNDTRYFEPKLSISAIFSGESKIANSKKLLPGELLEIVVRTSWLSPEEVYLPGRYSSFNSSPIANGKRLTLVGSEVLLYDRVRRTNQITGTVSFSVVTKEDFDFTVMHPKSGTANCSEKGYKLTTTNASSLSLAEENTSNSLKFTASSYAYLPDGTLNKGYAIIRIPFDWISCKYPNSELGLGEKFDVKVTSTDSSNLKQNPTSRASKNGGLLEVTVENFYFAQTEILIETDAAQIAQKKEAASKAAADAKAKAEADAKAKAAEEQRLRDEAEAKAKREAQEKADSEAKAKAESNAKTSSKKKSTITCVKGKTSKKVSGVNPKCPKGFKKK